MKNNIQITTIFLVTILVLSFGVYAAGGGGGGSGSNNNNQQEETIINTGPTTVDCEVSILITISQRVKCRLENRDNLTDSEEASIPEACRRLTLTFTANQISKEQCQRFYNDIQPCYSLPPTAQATTKDACFRRVSGLGTAAISGNTDKKAIRNYIVALLYEFEERIEDDYDTGSITSEQAGEVIDLIIRIKRTILDGGTREEIRPMLAELRSRLRDLRG